MYKRSIEHVVRPLQEGRIPCRIGLYQIDGKWVEMYEDEYVVYMANRPDFIKERRRSRRWFDWWLKYLKDEVEPKSCLQCPCSYDWTATAKCTVDRRLRIHDGYKQHEKCPIYRRGCKCLTG